MPPIPQNVVRRMAAYRPGTDVHQIPNTGGGSLYSAACWAWALTGGFMAESHADSASSIFDTILQHDYSDFDNIRFAVAINDVEDQFPGSGADFNALRQNLQPAHDGNLGAQLNFRVAMMNIAARKHGLTPLGVGNGHTHTLIMCTVEWYSWHHWGIGVRLPPNNTLTYVQTEPNAPIYHAGNAIGSAGQTVTTIGIGALKQAHIDVLSTIGPAPVRSAQCVVCGATHGMTPSVVRCWHQCATCGTVYCPAHGKTLAGKVAVLDGTRTCGQGGCGGRTALV